MANEEKSVEFLVNNWPRMKCSKCERSVKFFCPFCYEIVSPADLESFIPIFDAISYLNFPSISLDIFFQDRRKSSTVPQLKTLAPNHVEIIDLCDIPHVKLKAGEKVRSETFEYLTQLNRTYDPQEVVVVYPGEKATFLSDWAQEDVAKINKMILIDCPWQKANVIATHPTLQNLKQIKLEHPPVHSKFWRYHSAGDGCVSTLEATQIVLKEYLAAMKGNDRVKMSENVDKLSFLFDLVRTSITKYYDSEKSLKIPAPMTEEAKAHRRKLRDQKHKKTQKKIKQ